MSLHNSKKELLTIFVKWIISQSYAESLICYAVVTCPPTMEYGVCVSSCDRHCLSLSAPQFCADECEEGCVCPQGTYYSMHTQTCVKRYSDLHQALCSLGESLMYSSDLFVRMSWHSYITVITQNIYDKYNPFDISSWRAVLLLHHTYLLIYSTLVSSYHAHCATQMFRYFSWKKGLFYLSIYKDLPIYPTP